MNKEKVWYRADDPEKNKIGVWKSVERVIHEGTGYEYIKWRGYKWEVWNPNGSGYRIKRIL